MNNNGRPVPKNAGDIVGVSLEGVSRHDRLENCLWGWQGTKSHASGLTGTGVWCATGAKVWHERVLKEMHVSKLAQMKSRV